MTEDLLATLCMSHMNDMSFISSICVCTMVFYLLASMLNNNKK